MTDKELLSVLGFMFSVIILGVLIVLLGCHSKMEAVNEPAPTPAPVTCAKPPEPPKIRLFECYDGKKLVVRAFATSVIDLNACDDVKCVVK